ncbi:MAG: hypothetical protein IIA81_01375 [Thaumarchaeota archaeon]|nr:hypothetical protein [Nitrososphaerota archaeon]
MHPERQRSLWWILLPNFFGIIGSVIAYFILKNDDPRLAKFCLQFGILLTVIQIGTFLIIGPQLVEIDQNFGINI